MARKIYVDGPVDVLVGGVDCSTLTFPLSTTSFTSLGQTQRGVNVSVSTQTHRVTSDDEGGQEGNPAEILIMGSQARISLQLVKLESSSLATIRSGLYSPTTEGAFPLPGTPLFEGGHGCSLILSGRTQGLYFPKCELATAPREFNLSTTETVVSITFNAYGVTSAGSSSTASSKILYVVSSSGASNYDAGCADAIGGSVTS